MKSVRSDAYFLRVFGDKKVGDDGRKTSGTEDVAFFCLESKSRTVLTKRSQKNVKNAECESSKRRKVESKNLIQCKKADSKATLCAVKKRINSKKGTNQSVHNKKKNANTTSYGFKRVPEESKKQEQAERASLTAPAVSSPFGFISEPGVLSVTHNVNQEYNEPVFVKTKEEIPKSSQIKEVPKCDIKASTSTSTSSVSLSPSVFEPAEASVTNSVCQEGDSEWKAEEYLAECERIPITTAKILIDLFKNKNTIPFIARYRSHLIGNLSPDKLRKIKTTYEYIIVVHKKAKALTDLISSQKALSRDLRLRIQAAHSLEELYFIEALYKKNVRESLATRAREVGLEVPAKLILNGQGLLNLESFVSLYTKGLEDVKSVRLGIQHIIADHISKSAEVHLLLEKIISSEEIKLRSTFKKENGNVESSSKAKYQLYGNFVQPVTSVKPHQMMAINRAESEKVLSVKIDVPDDLWIPVRNYCNKKWLTRGNKYPLRSSIFKDGIEDAIKRLIRPFVVRRIRSKLNEEAEEEALEVFVSNLRRLFMTPPYRGKVVMAIDPGFAQGCKVAVVSPIGSLLQLNKFFLSEKHVVKKKLVDMVFKHGCETIALGNGTACRETEILVAELIQKGTFKPLNVSYTIVSEQAVSIYSCSPAAMEEFPNLHPTFVGAISLARRLQDPLSELVKVEPKHLGVGMYQHDLKEKKLVSALDEVVSECVSFVGVDLNSASLHLLKRVAGIGESRAQNIIKYRSENCPFQTREDLMKVKGIGANTFRQCAGFIRIIPSTARCARLDNCKNNFNPLDETCIHPESYDTVLKVIKFFGVELDHLGSTEFIQTLKARNAEDMVVSLAKNLNTPVLTMTLIVDTLTKPKDFDLRSVISGPVFRQEFKQIKDLCPGDKLNGVVRNIVPFGAFVDVGLNKNGLIHNSNMGGKKLHLNNHVSVQVTSADADHGRIQLKLLDVIE